MKISVVIPTYNSARVIRLTLDSVLRQTVAPHEILVLDDGSKDETVSILNSYGSKVSVIQQPNRGVAAARNELSGEGWALFAILFFWQIPHFLAIAWMYREEYEKAGFVMLPGVDPGGIGPGAKR